MTALPPNPYDQLADSDLDLKAIIAAFGYPPDWSRPNSFESLVHIILEQQVSLASAQVALDKLRQRLSIITPETVLSLNEDEFKGLYVSRQKKSYIQGLARELLTGRLDLRQLRSDDDQAIRQKLTALKGIGNWTVDIYLIMVLGRRDVFPLGDVAARTELRRVKGPEFDTAVWRPLRSAATKLLWHSYLSRRSR